VIVASGKDWLDRDSLCSFQVGNSSSEFGALIRQPRKPPQPLLPGLHYFYQSPSSDLLEFSNHAHYLALGKIEAS